MACSQKEDKDVLLSHNDNEMKNSRCYIYMRGFLVLLFSLWHARVMTKKDKKYCKSTTV